ncbi:MAG: glycoside hydrolase family 15 protein [Patescibacteria group bacterium]
MSIDRNKVAELLKTSERVFRESARENGAIMAIGQIKPAQSNKLINYDQVWPRIGSFVSLAADVLAIPLAEPWFNWLMNRPEDFAKDKLLFTNYDSEGGIGSAGRLFTPDQMGTVLLVLYRYYQSDISRGKVWRDLISRLADGLCQAWDQDHFLTGTADHWEDPERQTITDKENNFSYSLAACARGLLCANDFYENKTWRDTAKQMVDIIKKSYNKSGGYYYRSTGSDPDPTIDASLIGLTLPFEIIDSDDKKMIKTVQKIEETIVINGGVHRYQFDYRETEDGDVEGSPWPMLNFMMAMYWAERGNTTKAEAYYQWVIDRVDKYLPCQLTLDKQIKEYPYTLNHAFFVLATQSLGLL